MSVEKDGIKLEPAQFLHPAGQVEHNAALIILNSPISSYRRFVQLHKHARATICADGGANRLYDLLTDQYPDLSYDLALKKHLPTAVHGDLDSIKDGVREAYQSIGVPVTKDGDQYSTDFQKALKKVAECQPDVKHILVLGSLGGRVDQGIGLLHELYRERSHRRPDLHFWLFTESSLSFILRPGRTILSTPLRDGIFRRNMGLLPIYGPASISTEGLEWDVTDWPSSMGGNVSTSNHIMQDSIEITTDHEILFTVELA